jgi:hypothetical protein
MKKIQRPDPLSALPFIKTVWFTYGKQLGEGLLTIKARPTSADAVAASKIFAPIPFVGLLKLSSFL